ncbi:2OG-Fe(II) oxygenase [Leisingera aquimarina]|uniref:2OG-Fe(II) oxygenase n=1 Tax=Leisingera aquimarina TaxID=476529 RepID=UPI000488463E|nr:2OG-Fe(II) oxygenase [Leisingera aquimarina]
MTLIPLTERINAIDAGNLEDQLNAWGCATVSSLLAPEECDAVAKLYATDAPFRSHIRMARHGFGKGEYKYFAYPLPETVLALREGLYPLLAPIANDWNERMKIDTRFPNRHADYLSRCHDSGQVRPTPLLLQYSEGDYNCLHQDVYGELLFPLQVAVLLSEPRRDFIGGEFVLTEQRPRMQSRAEVLSLAQGDAVVFAVRNRPVRGTKSTYRVNMRHGVSRLHSGTRHTLGIIFHDAE